MREPESAGRSRLRPPLGPSLLLVGWALLILAWLMANPPFKSPDEYGHYLRAAGISAGDLVGEPQRFEAPALNVLGLTPRQQRTFDAYSRRVEIAADTSPFPCEPDRDGRCTTVTYVGNYQPLPYLLPALAMRAGTAPSNGDRLARVGTMAGVLAFLALALALVWGRTAASLLGITAAATPMVLFTASTMNPAGVEIASAIALTAAMLRIYRHGGHPPRWVWAAAAMSGVATTLAWQLGPVFMAFNVLLLLALLGGRGLREVRSSSLAPALATLAALVGAGLLYLLWRAAAGGDGVTLSLRPIGHGLEEGWGQLHNSWEGVVGVFGPFSDVKLPLVWHLTWALAALCVGVLALRYGRPRERLVLASAAATAFAFPILFYDAIYRHTGFFMQGRYILPLVLVVPLLAGEMLRRGPGGTGGLDRARPVIVVLLAAVQLIAWWANARVAAVGADGSWWFLGGDDFTPPLGWVVWTLVALAGSIAVAASGLPGAAPSAAKDAP